METWDLILESGELIMLLGMRRTWDERAMPEALLPAYGASLEEEVRTTSLENPACCGKTARGE